ncbi:hypothetical protein ACC692_38425, partial [Rhizobium ruizarguesonis]
GNGDGSCSGDNGSGDNGGKDDHVGMHSLYSSVPRTAALKLTTAGAAVAKLLLARREETAMLNFAALLIISIHLPRLTEC